MVSFVTQFVNGLRDAAAREPFGLRGALAHTIDTYSRSRRRAGINSARPSPETRALLNKLKTYGFASIEGFLTAQEAKISAERLTEVLHNNPQLIHPSTPYDLRLHGIENVDPAFQFFASHPLLNDVARLYLEEPAGVAFTLGASLQAVPGNPGSGGGWHRDSFQRQFKAMLYLTDVGPDNGPFQILEGSHKLFRTLRDNVILQQKYGNARLEHKQIEQLLERTGQSRLHTLGGKAGTLLLFDSSTIHRGSPIKAGARLALTNYFYPSADIVSSLYTHFKPVAGHSV